ncbi:SpoIIIAH-like family protein [Paenibacillus sp. SC116]|uniref:SpoIIIAH-like family protein n=1 Tax=Paenibacillus sp. SC116 TaxID=2968986 RepID=UPI00215A6516|nr:SpoIIIAH-like family protein [Paenibacillus sp. SC116]MCR8843167.1 SpoIIIAH-like family protein [Paenibacillus sp. SC116]
MNTKRQTIWLVSMLSLMVVLSAYYLFTEEPAKPDPAAGIAAVNKAAGEAGTAVEQLPKVEVTQVSGTEVQPTTEGKTETGGKTDGAATTTETKEPVDASTTKPEGQAPSNESAAKDSKQTLTDGEKAILDQVAAEGVMSRSTIEQKAMERSEQYQQQLENILTKLNGSKVSSEEMTKLYDDMTRLDEKEVKITALEAELQKDYPNVVISEENNNVKVIVQAEKLEARQAVDIIDKIINELQVTQDKVSVQYVTE